MYTSIAAFLKDWNGESASTRAVLSRLTDASLGQRVTPEGRSLGSLAWHIVVTLGEMGEKAGLTVLAPAESTPPPASAAAIAAAYDTAAMSAAAAVERSWTDAALAETIPMYGEQWTRAETLLSLVRHEIHHRAQMTVLMRQAGLTVPGIYGPSREEWAQFGMTAPQ